MNESLEIGGRKLQVVELEGSDLQFKSAMWRIKSTQKVGGFISFSGAYHSGSAGKMDALFIRWRTRELMDIVRPDGLVVSFMDLTYEYGDDLDLPWSPLDGPLQIVCSALNKESVAGIFGAEDIANTIDDAIKAVSRTLSS